MAFEKTAVALLAAAAVLFLVLSSMSLFVFPVADSYRWYGDETWLMLAWRSLILHGQMTVPIALGSTLTTTSGFLFGSCWLSGIVYAVPQILSPASTDIVHIGRTVTFTLALTDIFLLAWFGFRRKLNAFSVLLAVVLLVSAKSFVIHSHSARYDIAAGLTVLAVAGSFAIQAAQRRERSAGYWFVFGAIGTLLALGICSHLQVLLPPMGIYIAWYFGAFRSVRKACAFFAGGVATVLLLLGLFWIFNPAFSIFGGAGHGNLFFAIIQDMPVTKFYSRSAQSHQLWAKSYYLWHEAGPFSFALPAIFVSEGVLTMLKHRNATRTFVFFAFCAALFSYMFLQGVMPYYLSHVLPIMALALAFEVDAWCKVPVVSVVLPTIGVVAMLLIVHAEYDELIRARDTGKTLTQNNIAAVQASVEGIERDTDSTIHHPLVLAQAPAVSELLRDTLVRVMSESFLFFPEHDEPVDSVVRHQHVAFVIDYNRPMNADYRKMIAGMGEPLFQRTGHMIDRFTDYFHGDLGPVDTLSVYRVTQ